MARLDQSGFPGGEVSGSLIARRETAKYQSGLRRLRNMLLTTAGAAYTRPGFEFCAEVQDSAEITTLIPFQANPTQGYALEFGDERLRFYYKGAPILTPEIIVTGITQAGNGVVAAPAHGYAVGKTVFFQGILGMHDINGRFAKIIAVTTDTFTLDLDTTTFNAFTGSTGGIAGNANGGVSGQPPPPDPATDPAPPTADVEDDPPTVPKGDWYFDESGNYIPGDGV